jgi:hypothetical protein
LDGHKLVGDPVPELLVARHRGGIGTPRFSGEEPKPRKGWRQPGREGERRWRRARLGFVWGAAAVTLKYGAAAAAARARLEL